MLEIIVYNSAMQQTDFQKVAKKGKIIMNIIYTMHSDENGKSIEATCGKTTAEIIVTSHQIIVLCKNASHYAWRGMGKCFANFESAKQAYKSAAMKSIIELAQTELQAA